MLHPFFPVLLEYAFVMGLPGIKIVLSGFGRRFDGAFRGQLIQQLAAAPLAVAPAFQRQGIGTALIREGERRAREMGYQYIVILGSPAYYGRLGYGPAERYGIRPPFPVESAYFMAQPLRPGVEKLDGVVQYAPEFGI